MNKEILHSIILITIISISFVLVKTPIFQYDLQIFTAIFTIYFIDKKFVSKNSSSNLPEAIFFVLIINLIVGMTGLTQSPYFFLYYFLVFALSLLIEPIISIVVSLTICLYLLLFMEPTSSIVSILSLPFLTPFALFLGKQYEANLQNKKTITAMDDDKKLFLSLVLKNNIKNIIEIVDNFRGDHDLTNIKNNAKKMDKLIDEYENN